MNIEFTRTEWTNGKGFKLMEGLVEFPKCRVTLSEPIDSRTEDQVKDALRVRLEALAPEYS